MSILFEPSSINQMTLKNRFVRSATWEGMANADGSCSPELINLMEELALGGIGLIISGHAYISRDGQAGQRQMGIYGDELIPGLAKMAETVHQQNSKILVQLSHAGCQAEYNIINQQPSGPSVAENRSEESCREMSREDIHQIIEDFGRAAARAKKAGFDGVQIHAAHGYLMSQFLSPFYNKREDEYGGELENRARIVLEVVRMIRDQVGEKFSILIKMNSEDFLPGGLSVKEMVRVAAMLEKTGVDAIEMSGGTVSSGKYTPVRRGKLNSPEKEVYYREAAIQYKERIMIPLLLVGGIRSFEVAQKLVKDGLTDYIAFCRPLIREPGLINRWKSGNTAGSTCRSCNLCFKPIMEGRGIHCLREEKLRDNR